MSKQFDTIATHGAGSASYEGAVSFPIFQTATYSGSDAYSYTRCANPTREELQRTVALLEGGKHGFAFASGLAAVCSVFSLLRAGDHVLLSDDLYGGTYRAAKEIFEGFGVSFTFADLRHPADAELFLQRNTKLIFAETPTNPTMKVIPLGELSTLAKANGVLLAVDNTFLTPYFQKPFLHGADIVIHSGTKFLAGHHDTGCGIAVVKDDTLAQRLALLQRTLGNALSPFDSWLTLRGLQTLPIRMDKHQKNALSAAEFLFYHPRVETVLYPGLPSHPAYETNKKQATGAGGVLSFVLKDDRVEGILRGGELIRFAESLGGTTSLITYPKTQTHASVPEDVRNRMGITSRLLRLSVGLEHEGDLLTDLEELLSRK